MKRRRNHGRSGQALIEFTLVGIPMIFITISIVGGSIDMWEFQSLAYATEMTARYASMHGATCGAPNNCTITLGNVATFFATQAMALPSGSVNVTFTVNDGSSTTCNPLNSCNSSAAQFPSTSNNSVGSDITVSATFRLTNPLAMFWPPDKDGAKTYTVGAKSRQRIQF